jgi:uncharacterized protein YceH (UPF0502 family)
MNERRNASRQKSFLRGSIQFNNRRTVIDCLVRDISASGARLIFSDSVTVPDVLELYIPQREQTLRAHVQWRRGEELGVAVTKSGRAPAPSKQVDDDLAERVEKLEAEIASLKKMVKRLKADIAGSAEEAA